jgi:hypothetical protein
VPVPAIYMVGARFNVQAVLSIYCTPYYCTDLNAAIYMVGVKMNGKRMAGLRHAEGAAAIQTGAKNAAHAVRRGSAAIQTRP